MEALKKQLDDFIEKTSETVSEDGLQPALTTMLQRVIQYAQLHAQSAGAKEVDTGQMLAALYQAEKSQAVFLLRSHGVEKLDVLSYLSHGIAKDDPKREPAFATPEEESAPSRDPLKSFAVDLIDRAKNGEIDPLIGRSLELERTIQILCRRRKNNPLFVGEPGVGKTAIAEGLALKIQQGDVPPVLKNAEVFSLDMGAVLAGTKYRGEFEAASQGGHQRSGRKEGRDPVHRRDPHDRRCRRGQRRDDGRLESSSSPRSPQASCACIGSTTYGEYKQSLERDRALARRFQKIEIGEPTVAETIEILQGLKSYYEQHHGVTYTPEAIQLAAELSAKYINDRHLPDKAIDVLDEAGARARMLRVDESSSRPVDEQGAPLRDSETPRLADVIGVHEVETVVARMAKIPPRTVAVSEKERLQRARIRSPRRDLRAGSRDSADRQRDQALALRPRQLRQADRLVPLLRADRRRQDRARASQLAQSLGVEFIRFDMSEYMEPHTVSRLIGAPPGYVGFDQGGLLTDAILKTPYAVLVLDEIEKAHPNLFSILLQVMDHATLTDNNGKKADFRNVILIMTTNAGAREMTDASLGFMPSGATRPRTRRDRAHVRPRVPQPPRRLDRVRSAFLRNDRNASSTSSSPSCARNSPPRTSPSSSASPPAPGSPATATTAPSARVRWRA